MKYFSLTDIGKKREKNEDSYYSQINNYAGTTVGFFAIADGMGGYENGEYASKKAIEEVVNYVDEEFKKLDFSNIFDDDIKKIFEKALSLANNVIYEKSKTSSPMGTTFVSGIIVNDKIFIANVGDSRAYMLNGDNFTQITKDNSYVQELIEEGILDEDKARTHENKNEITRAVGYYESLEVDFYVREVQSSDKILICSDGLTNMVEDNFIKSIFQQNNDPENICMELVFLANTNGGKDNITITVIEIE